MKLPGPASVRAKTRRNTMDTKSPTAEELLNCKVNVYQDKYLISDGIYEAKLIGIKIEINKDSVQVRFQYLLKDKKYQNYPVHSFDTFYLKDSETKDVDLSDIDPMIIYPHPSKSFPNLKPTDQDRLLNLIMKINSDCAVKVANYALIQSSVYPTAFF